MNRVPVKLKIMLNNTIQRFNGKRKIGFGLGNFMELTSFNVFNVRILIEKISF